MEPKHCEHCADGEYIVRVKKYWHRITPGLVGTLVKVYKRVCEKNQNLVHMNELELNHSEYGNFQKLRFHALIAKYRKNGEAVHRSWVITTRGAAFLRSNMKIPLKVRTLLNRVVAHSEELVDIAKVMRSDITWEGYEDFKNQLPMVEFSPPEENIDETVVAKKIKKKKGKNYCPKCDSQLKLSLESKQNDTGTVSVEKWWICPHCGYKEFDF